MWVDYWTREKDGLNGALTVVYTRVVSDSGTTAGRTVDVSDCDLELFSTCCRR